MFRIRCVLPVLLFSAAVLPAEAVSVTEFVASLLTPDNLAKHYLELIGLACIAAYIAAAVAGTRQNREISTTWFRWVSSNQLANCSSSSSSRRMWQACNAVDTYCTYYVKCA